MLRRSRRVTFVLAVLIVLAIASIAYAAVTLYYSMPMSATVSAAVEIYVDGEKWSNNTEICWGNVMAGESYNKTLSIRNLGGCNVTVVFTVENLPTGWALTFTGNNTVVKPQTWLNGTLTLTVPANATSGEYAWNCHLQITG